eukprot:scaffold1605_cov63-Phaeocystis_antarctica.AAC.3
MAAVLHLSAPAGSAAPARQLGPAPRAKEPPLPLRLGQFPGPGSEHLRAATPTAFHGSTAGGCNCRGLPHRLLPPWRLQHQLPLALPALHLERSRRGTVQLTQPWLSRPPLPAVTRQSHLSHDCRHLTATSPVRNDCHRASRAQRRSQLASYRSWRPGSCCAVICFWLRAVVRLWPVALVVLLPWFVVVVTW